MTFENQQEIIFNEIATLINDIIPTKWEKFDFHGELKEFEGGEVYFFYTLPNENEKLHYCYFIPDEFNVSRDIYDNLMLELFDLLVKLQKVFKENEQELWYSFSMFVDSELKMDAIYDYVDWSTSEFGPSDRINYFQYKYLNVVFDDTAKQQKMLAMETYEKSQN